MSEYTKGPWSLNKYGEPVGPDGENIRAKGLALTNSEEAKANSSLIAAAPEMLDALRKCASALLNIVSDSSIKQTTVLNAWAQAVEAEATARQVIAKALGEDK